MDFGGLIQQIVGFGLPILGNALGGPLGGAAASIIAKALGAQSASASDISAALQTTDKDVAIQKLKSAEAEFVASVQSEANIQVAQLQQVGETIRAEIQAATGMSGALGRLIQFMQYSWRPLFAYQTLLECTVMGGIAAHELWTGDSGTVNQILAFQGFLTWYMGMKFALLGVYAGGRSYEKANGAGDPTAAIMPSWVKALIDTVRGKK